MLPTTAHTTLVLYLLEDIRLFSIAHMLVTLKLADKEKNVICNKSFSRT